MEHTLANVFKIIIIAVLFGMMYTAAVCLVDVFVTIDRVQGVAEFVQIDIAKNNCMLNDIYESTCNQLKDISDKSRYMRVCSYGHSFYDDVTNTEELTSWSPIELYSTNKTRSDFTNTNFIQEKVGSSGNLEVGVADANPPLVKKSGTFCVANYGDILCLRINAVIRPTMWTIKSSGGVADSGWLDWGKIPVHLTYYVPALTYLK